MFEATVDEFESIMSKQRGAQDETVVRLRGLPWDATESDIAEFFNGTCWALKYLHCAFTNGNFNLFKTFRIQVYKSKALQTIAMASTSLSIRMGRHLAKRTCNFKQLKT